MITSKNLILLVTSFISLSALSQKDACKINLVVTKRNSLVVMDFRNDSKCTFKIPNYMLLCSDTLKGYKVISAKYVRVACDTLYFQSLHTFEKKLNEFDKKELNISDTHGNSMVRIEEKLMVLKKKIVQTFRLPKEFKGYKFNYFALEFDGSVLVAKLKDLHF